MNQGRKFRHILHTATKLHSTRLDVVWVAGWSPLSHARTHASASLSTSFQYDMLARWLEVSFQSIIRRLWLRFIRRFCGQSADRCLEYNSCNSSKGGSHSRSVCYNKATTKGVLFDTNRYSLGWDTRMCSGKQFAIPLQWRMPPRL